jgi:tetratricopeptide (TPR) repeat protein
MNDYYSRPVLTSAPVDYRDLTTDQVRSLLQESLSALSSGQPLAMVRGLGLHDMHSRLAEGRALAEAGDFERAFSIAFDLFLLDPGEHRHAYLAGLCMHQLGEQEGALGFFLAADRIGPIPEAIFGSAECFEAMGDHASAIRCYDRFAEMTRGQAQYEDLRDSATDAAHALYMQLTPAAPV